MIEDRELIEEIRWSTPGKPSKWDGLEHPIQIMARSIGDVEQYYYNQTVVYQYPPGKFYALESRMGHEGDHETIDHYEVEPHQVTITEYCKCQSPERTTSGVASAMPSSSPSKSARSVAKGS